MCQMPHYFLATSSEFSVQLSSGKKSQLCHDFSHCLVCPSGCKRGEGCGTDMATDTDADMDTDRDEVVWRCIKAGSSKFSFYLFCKVLRQNWAHCSTTLTPFYSSFCLACDSVTGWTCHGRVTRVPQPCGRQHEPLLYLSHSVCSIGSA